MKCRQEAVCGIALQVLAVAQDAARSGPRTSSARPMVSTAASGPMVSTAVSACVAEWTTPAGAPGVVH